MFGIPKYMNISFYCQVFCLSFVYLGLMVQKFGNLRDCNSYFDLLRFMLLHPPKKLPRSSHRGSSVEEWSWQKKFRLTAEQPGNLDWVYPSVSWANRRASEGSYPRANKSKPRVNYMLIEYRRFGLDHAPAAVREKIEIEERWERLIFLDFLWSVNWGYL